MMDVNSQGGYYSEKSPKLLLHEYCIANKRPRPKYKVLAAVAELGSDLRHR